MSSEKRIAIRAGGVKDNFHFYDSERMRYFKHKDVKTSMTGQFEIGDYKLVGCVPKCPSCQLIFENAGYETKTYHTKSISEDSIFVYLEKL